MKLGYVNNPVFHQSWKRVHWYAELAVSCPTVTEIIANTHCTCTGYLRRGGQAEWAMGLSGLDKYGDGRFAKGQQSQY